MKIENKIKWNWSPLFLNLINIAISIAYIYLHKKSVIKTIHHTVNVTFMEAVLFAIRCGINQATTIYGISKIVAIIDSIYAVRRIFDSSLHLFQIYIAAISAKLRKFFAKNHYNSIEFWECSSCYE